MRLKFDFINITQCFVSGIHYDVIEMVGLVDISVQRPSLSTKKQKNKQNDNSTFFFSVYYHEIEIFLRKKKTFFESINCRTLKLLEFQFEIKSRNLIQRKNKLIYNI